MNANKVLLSFFIFTSLLFSQFIGIKAQDLDFSTKQVLVENINQETQTINPEFSFNAFSIKFAPKSETINSLSFEYSTNQNNSDEWKEINISNEIIPSNIIAGESDVSLSAHKADDIDTNLISQTIYLDQNQSFLKIKISDFDSISDYTVYFINDQIDNSNLLAVSENRKYNFDYLNGLKIITRSEWGCPDNDPNSHYYCNGPEWFPYYYPTTHIIIHHTATSNNATDWKREVRGIWNQHAHARDADQSDGVDGWTDIGYNFLIDPNGEIYEGRYGGEGVTGGHTFDHNMGNSGIAMLGTFSDSDITPQARETLNKLVSSLSSRYRFDPNEVAADITGTENLRVSSHRNWQSTGCPGNVFYSTLDGIRNEASYESVSKSYLNQKQDACPIGFTMADGRCVRYSSIQNWSDAGESPVSITKDKLGNLFIANFNTAQVSEITLSSNHSVVNNVGEKPRGIVMDSVGNIYTANYGSKSISKIDQNGNSTYIASLPGRPYSIAIDSLDNIFTANIDHNTITRVSNTGVAKEFEIDGFNPTSIAVDLQNNAYTANYLSNSIAKLSPDGKTSVTNLNGENPIDLVIDNSGNIYTANYGTNDITQINPDGRVSTFAAVDKKPIAITADENGYLYTIHENSSNITKIDPNGFSDIIDLGLQNPKDILASNGKIYITNYDAHTITAFWTSEEGISPTLPVYRFWSSDNKTHFYTSNTGERDHIINSYPENVWKYEGTEFYSFENQESETQPVFRFWSEKRQKHFYTINASEKDHLINTDSSWSFEGIAYYAFTESKVDLKPVYRFWSPGNESHFFTINEAEKNHLLNTNKSWKFEGVAFYTYN